ncbi:MAG: LysE family transporter [Thermoleophilaceae bacterium]
MTALLVGFGLGFFVGAQPGPVSLLCVRSVLRGAFAAGVAIGAGAALIDLLYAALGLAGAASLLEIDALRIGLGTAGALVLAAIGARTLWAPSSSSSSVGLRPLSGTSSAPAGRQSSGRSFGIARRFAPASSHSRPSASGSSAAEARRTDARYSPARSQKRATMAVRESSVVRR